MLKSEEDVFDLIAAHVADIAADITHGPITRASMLSPLGIDSIGHAELIARMREELSLTSPAHEFYNAANLGELAALLAGKLQASKA